MMRDESGNAPATLLVICGMPGSGKSTLASQCSRRLGLPVVNTDDLVNAIRPDVFGRASVDDRFDLAQDMLNYVARIELEAGRSVILDASMSDRGHWHPLIQLTNSPTRRLLAYRLSVPFVVLYERVKTRAAEGTSNVIKHDEAMLKAFAERCERGQRHVEDRLIDLDGCRPTDELADIVEMGFRQTASKTS